MDKLRVVAMAVVEAVVLAQARLIQGIQYRADREGLVVAVVAVVPINLAQPLQQAAVLLAAVVVQGVDPQMVPRPRVELI